ncbi:hypothetical protein ABZ801_24555 [Actinomadura sp. NPDC047616]|uniref:hypothetical protein n=1 Tax=Actinomadura sp. NPDC047616 TaxID=3155914 RepID=UPI0033F66FD6
MPTSPDALTPEALEERIAELRAAVRRAMAAGDRGQARTLRAELRGAERAWDEAVLGDGGDPADERPRTGGGAERGLLPVRDQVHQALTLLGVPAAPKLIGSVYAAFFPGEIPGTRLTSLRRDEERSFRAAPYARPYYLCAGLTADLLAAARGLVTVSTWPLEQRIVGPLSPRTDFLTAAMRVAEHAGRGDAASSPEVRRLLWRFAANIPGAADVPATGTVGVVDPAVLAEAARAELDVHEAADRDQRRQAAERARAQLDEAELLFGTRLRAMRTAASAVGGVPPGAPAPAVPRQRRAGTTASRKSTAAASRKKTPKRRSSAPAPAAKRGRAATVPSGGPGGEAAPRTSRRTSDPAPPRRRPDGASNGDDR